MDTSDIADIHEVNVAFAQPEWTAEHPTLGTLTFNFETRTLDAGNTLGLRVNGEFIAIPAKPLLVFRQQSNASTLVVGKSTYGPGEPSTTEDVFAALAAIDAARRAKK